MGFLGLDKVFIRGLSEVYIGVLSSSIGFNVFVFKLIYSLHCSSFLGLPYRTLNKKLVKQKKELQ